MSVMLDATPNTAYAIRKTNLLCRVLGHRNEFIEARIVPRLDTTPAVQVALGCQRCGAVTEMKTRSLTPDEIHDVSGYKPRLHWCGGRVRE